MKLNVKSAFFISAAVLLIVTAVAKFISVTGSSKILDGPDPLLSISFRRVLLLSGGIEILVAMVCLISRNIWRKSVLVAWLATLFLIYRICLRFSGYYSPCKCLGLGEFTSAIHISQAAADSIMKCVLIYLLAGSYAIIIMVLLRRNANKANGSLHNIKESEMTSVVSSK